MVKTNTLEDLSGQPITRQNLFDMWRNSNLQTIQTTDLAEGVLPIVSQASEPSAAPGSLWHDTTRDVFYLYVVDSRNHLLGVLSLRQLILARPEQRLGEFMSTNVVSVRTDADQEEVARLVSRYDFLAIPVVDDQNRLVG